MKRLAGFAGIALLIAACTGSAPSPSPTLGATGILLVGVGEQVQSRPPNEAVAMAFSRAMETALGNGDDLGYPWIDPVTGELVLSAATARGRGLIEAAGITVPHRIRDVSHPAPELRVIQDDVTFLHSRGVPNSELIYMTIPDERDNRALIVISAMSPALLEYLAAQYPPDALAVMVDPARGGAGTGTQ